MRIFQLFSLVTENLTKTIYFWVMSDILLPRPIILMCYVHFYNCNCLYRFIHLYVMHVAVCLFSNYLYFFSLNLICSK